MKSVLVIGGAGFIGSRLVPELRSLGHQVTVNDLHWFTAGGSTNAPKEDLLGPAHILSEKDIAKFDTLIFLGGLSNDPMADFDPYANFFANATTPAYLAEIAKRAGVKTFIHGGSCSVYGLAAKVTESSPVLTTTPYGISKLMGEVGVSQQASHMRTVLFRMGTVAGWSPRMRFDLVVNAMMKSALTAGVIIVNDGSAERPILDITDAVRAYVHAVEEEDISGIINLASENTTVYDIALTVQSILKATGKEVPIQRNHVKEIRSYSVSTARARRLGLYFTGSVHDAAMSVFKNFHTIENPEDARYYNIKTFTAQAAR